MKKKETNLLFKIASLFAEATYVELFNYQPDTSKEETRKLLDALRQAWLTGYNYLRQDDDLLDAIEEKFLFYIESDIY